MVDLRRNRLIYSQAMTARLMAVSTRVIKEVRQFAWVVWVWLKGRRPMFVSKARYSREFVDLRRKNGLTLRILGQRPTNYGTLYQVESQTSSSELMNWMGGYHRVEVTPDRISCTCEDFHNQADILGTEHVACKHVYRVLHEIGYSRLSDYRANRCLRGV